MKINLDKKRLQYEERRKDLSREQAAAVWRAGIARYLLRKCEQTPAITANIERYCARLNILWPPEVMEDEVAPSFDDNSLDTVRSDPTHSSDEETESEEESEEEMGSNHIGDIHTPPPSKTPPLPPFYRGQGPAVSDSAILRSQLDTLLDLKRQRSPEEAQKELRELKKTKIRMRKTSI